MGQCLARNQGAETAGAIESSQKNEEPQVTRENTHSSEKAMPEKAMPLMLNQSASELHPPNLFWMCIPLLTMFRSALSCETTLTVGGDLARKVTSRRNLFEAGTLDEVEDIKDVKNVALVAHNVKCVY